MIGFLDCYSGASGNMLLGAILDAGLPADELSAALAGLELDGFERLDVSTVMRGPLRATLVDVVVASRQMHRPFSAIVELLGRARLAPAVRERSLDVLRRIVEVEAAIHGQPPDQVELHEVGAVDSIVDVVGTIAGLELLGVDRLYASALPMSPGQIAGRHHGPLPAPAPATLALVAAAHAPVRSFGDGYELVTPTGAALVTSLAAFEQPTMTVERVGYGAGGMELAWPNVLRLWLGQPVAGSGERARTGPGGERHEHGLDDAGHVVIEANLDDMSPQLLAPVTERLLAAGALDVTLSPLQMKKGRPGTLVSVIAAADDEGRLADLLLRETTTLGVRVHGIRRHEAGRAFQQVETAYGPLTVKLKLLDGEVVAAMPEFEAVREAALGAGAPLATVHAAAAAAGQALVGGRMDAADPAAGRVVAAASPGEPG